MLNRKNNSKSARSVLLEDFNDLDIYIEDTAVESKKIYRELLKRVFEGKYRLEDVFPIGSCSKVIKEWERHKQIDDKRKKIFIIDGDFILLNNDLLDKINSAFHQNLTGLYVLPRYCIENFLIDKEPLLDVAHDEDPTDDIEKIDSNINFEEWVNHNENLLIDLFITYSIIIKNDIGEKTIKFKVSNLEDIVNPGVVCKDMIKLRLDYLKSKILEKKPSLDLDSEIDLRKKHIENLDYKLLKIVSGKDYLFPLIKRRINNKNRFIPESISLKIRLAKTCSVDDLLDIEKHIM